ncbi:hypothetical protein EC968_003559 [Mortierella alpina]|nr:hypothetical protein EC968_003559 [Mortierella alpina]
MPPLLCPFTLLLVLVSLLSTVQAQVAPAPVQELAFARAGSKLYIQGGKLDENGARVSISSQLFSLDLSVGWPVNAPVWQVLAPGQSTYFLNGVVTSDNQNFLTIRLGVNNSLILNKYNIATDHWAGTQTVFPPEESRQGIRPVVDPNTGLVYMNAWANMNVFNPSDLSITLKPMPANVFTSRLFSGAAYNKLRGSILYYGGLNASIKLDPAATYVTEYTISTGLWSRLTTSGVPPVPRADFCMTSNDEGTKVVVYGGRIEPDTTTTPPTEFTGTIHVLDVPSGIWTEGPVGTVRGYMACTLVGDQFIAWGGSDGINTVKGPPVIFNINTNQWAIEYKPPAFLAAKPTAITGGAPPSSTTAASSSSGDSTSNLGAILGGTFGALFVIALAGIVYLYLKRREDKEKYGIAAEQQLQGRCMQEAPEVPASVLQNQQFNGAQVRGPQNNSDNDQTLHRDPQDIHSMNYQIPSPQRHYVVQSKNAYTPDSMHNPPSALTVIDQPFTANNYVIGTNGEVYVTYSPSTTGAISQDVSTYGGTPASSHYPYNSSYAVPAYTSNTDVHSTQPMPTAGYSAYSSTVSNGTSSTLNANTGLTGMTTTMPDVIVPLNAVSLPQRPVQGERAFYMANTLGHTEGDRQSQAVTSDVQYGYVPPPHPLPPQ